MRIKISEVINKELEECLHNHSEKISAFQFFFI